MKRWGRIETLDELNRYTEGAPEKKFVGVTNSGKMYILDDVKAKEISIKEASDLLGITPDDVVLIQRSKGDYVPIVKPTPETVPLEAQKAFAAPVEATVVPEVPQTVQTHPEPKEAAKQEQPEQTEAAVPVNRLVELLRQRQQIDEEIRILIAE